MRALIWAVVILAAIYSGYWFLGARAARGAVEAQFANLQAAGYTAERSDFALRGFPSRFDLTVENPRLGDPSAGVEWSAPFAQVFSLSYKPWHLIAALPNEQVITLPGDQLTVTSDSFMGSLVVQPGTSLPLDRMNIAIDALAVTASAGALGAAQRVRLATRQEAMQDNAHEFAVQLSGLAPDPAILAGFGRAGLPSVIETVDLAGVAQFDGPILPANPGAFPVLSAVTLYRADLVWGDLRMTGKGEVTPDATGLAQGALTVEITGWQVIPGALQAAGAIQPDAMFVVTAMLSGLAQQDGTPEVLTLPLTFRNGLISLGEWPIGPAPRLR